MRAQTRVVLTIMLSHVYLLVRCVSSSGILWVFVHTQWYTSIVWPHSVILVCVVQTVVNTSMCVYTVVFTSMCVPTQVGITICV